ncbi:LysM peptidoglycan-binding domain-containing protein [Amycolatopsis sp. NPDC059021]|uniref:LysM peptidoglycan-binding domain-containing protein n=1 Tax=Amycolatopsis sp. NPDC059021 TaxID=3346704 RepID=UPI00366DB5C5
MTSRTAQRLRGGLAALALGAFLAGVPCVLLALGATPARLLPDRWPEQVPISQWPERLWNALRWAWLTGDLVADLMIAVAWAGWGLLTLSAITEFVRQTGHGVRAARGVLARVPGGRWIAGLVTAILVATSVGTASATGVPAAPVAATAPPWPQQPTTTPSPAADAVTAVTARSANRTEGASVAPAARHEDAVPYTVVHGDTLWGLAERHLGAGTRYHDIVRLNPERLAHGADELRPGWVLLLPADAHNLPDPAAVAASDRTVVVAPGDTLSAIAARELGDAHRWQEVFASNVGRTQPDGRALRDPDLLLPGWHLHLPTTRLPGETSPGEQQPHAPAPPSPSIPPTVSPSASPQPAPDTALAPAEKTTSGDQSDHRSEPGLNLSTGAFVSVGLAAAIAAAVVSARIWRRRGYRIGSGDRADLHRSPAPVVRALRAVHDHDDDERPPVADADLVDIMPTPQDRRATRGTLEPASQPVPVSVGVRGSRELALNLASTRGLGLAGPGATSAARALLLHLLTERHTDPGIDVLVPADDLRFVFDGVDVGSVPSTVHVAASLEAAVAEMETALLTRTRRTDEEAEPPAPGPLVLFARPQPHVEHRLHAVLGNGATLGLAGVLLGQWGLGTTAHIHHDGAVTATRPCAEVLSGTRLFTLPVTDATALLTALRSAEGPATPTEHDGANLPDHQPALHPDRGEEIQDFGDAVQPTARSGKEALRLEAARPPGGEEQATAASPAPAATVTAAEAPAPLHLRVLGRLHLTRGAPHEADLIDVLAPRQREILVYLALHPDGARREVLTAALWPDAPGDRPYNAFHATMSQLRRGLRTATDNEITDLTVTGDGHYALDPTLVTVDLWQLQEALAARRHATTRDDTIAATRRVTALYQGELADGIAADWIDGPREALRRDVLDALSTLIRTIGHDDLEQTLALLEHARRLDPYNEAIYRDLMRTQARLGQHDNIPRTLSLLTHSLATLDQKPTRDTLGLADLLRQPRNAPRRSQQAS